MPFLRIKTWSNKRRHAKDGYALHRILRDKYRKGDYVELEKGVLRFIIDMAPKEYTREEVLEYINQVGQYEARQ